jgi:hypothetical protein
VTGSGGIAGGLRGLDGGVYVSCHLGMLEPGPQRGPQVGQVSRPVWMIGGSGIDGGVPGLDCSIQVGQRLRPLKPRLVTRSSPGSHSLRYRSGSRPQYCGGRKPVPPGRMLR